MIDPGKIKDVDNWDAHWQIISDSTESSPAEHYRQKTILKFLSRYLDESKPSKILDIGSGQGDLIHIIHEKFVQSCLVGFELSETGVKISRAKNKQASFHVVDLLEVPQEIYMGYSGWADLAILSEVLEHVDDPVHFLNSAKSFIKKEGILIITVPGGPMNSFERSIGHRQHFTKTTITQLINKANLKICRVYQAGFPFFNLYKIGLLIRGRQLIEDLDLRGSKNNKLKFLMRFVSIIFDKLSVFNLLDSVFGWQLIVVAYQPFDNLLDNNYHDIGKNYEYNENEPN